MLLLLFLPLISGMKDLAWYSSGPSVPSPVYPTNPIKASTAIDFCQLPPDAGKCSQQLVRYYYDAQIDECKRFTYSGCGGNSNRFMRRAHCRNRCVKHPNKFNISKDGKHRRTATTSSTILTTSPATTTDSATNPAPVTIPVKKISLISSAPLCHHCDPLFGTCVNGECGCMKGFRSLGKICVDLNECDNGSICGPFARCVNTVGSYTCECDSGFQIDGSCQIGPEACMDEFDINLTEEDCNHGKQEIRYYYDSENSKCKQFFYGGCKTNSRNFFADLQTCDVLCVENQRKFLENASRKISNDPTTTKQFIKGNHYKIDLISSPASISTPDKPLSVEDWPLRPPTLPPLNLNFSNKPTISNADKITEAEKAETIIKSITPQQNRCESTFDAVLREECISAEWVERFYWNSEFQDCEPFWYDASCDPRDTAGKNFFETYNGCQRSCKTHNEETTTTPTNTADSSFFKIIDNPKNYLEDELTNDFKDINPTKSSENNMESAEATTSNCHLEFDSELRNECINAEWEELFYWNEELKECEAFWHDASCDTPDFKNNNLFKTWDDCNKDCIRDHEIESIKTLEELLSTDSIISSLNSSSSELATDESNYTQSNPLNLILKEALNPDKSSQLPEKFPPNHEQLFLNFASKSEPTATTKFDRLKYMTEFKKRLQSFPDNYTTKLLPTIAPKISSTPPQVTTTSFEEFVAEEKRKIEKTLEELDRPSDFCDEPLHPKLEEDCNNDKWEIRWFFNSDRGSCKSFWYGGCAVETKNFFLDHTSCRLECSHKYTTNFQSNIAIPPGILTTPASPRKDRLTTSLKLTYPHSEDLFPPQDDTNAIEIDGSGKKRRKEVEKPSILKTTHTSDDNSITIVNILPGSRKTEEPSFYSHIDKVLLDMKTGEHEGFTKPEEFVNRVEAASNSFVKYDIAKPEVVTIVDRPGPSIPTIATTSENPITRSINDACDDEYDPKWDEDCLGDKWVVRSHYDSTKGDCKSFWYGGCQTSSRNLWFDKETCRSSCAHKFQTTTESVEVARSTNTARVISPIEFQVDIDQKLADVKREHEGREDLKYSRILNHPVTVSADCLEHFNESLSKPCADGKVWKNRYYYDTDSRACRMFWSNGCEQGSRNDFDDLETCQWKCEGRHPQPAGKSCLDQFDKTYLEDCRHGEFTNRFYFDHSRKKCVEFHWGGCQSKSQNFFADMNQCQQLCESPPRELTQACIQPFDENYKKSCTSEKPQQYYYFDSMSGNCKLFWFGNCKGENENIFSTLETCQWICERKREERKPAICSDKFDSKYTESCANGQWAEKWYFDQSSGECTSFWWDGCTSTSQNIFPDEKSCTSNCEHPGFEISSQLASDDSKFRCLEPIEIGNCEETYPAFYYDRSSKTCRPFSYSGCGGNSNRFMTLSQCENLCYAFNHLNEAEIDCHLPMHIGYGKNEENCLPQAGFRFYFDRSYAKCSKMWYLGCGGNANNFYSYDICQRTCSKSDRPREIERKTRASSEVCFQAPGDRGTCSNNSTLTRWTYSQHGKCTQFTYSGCGGNANRFANEELCKRTCHGRKNSNDPRICSFPPDWGTCNQLRYMWFYNNTRGTCDQFLYGGCAGNSNRFETFEICQKTCELSGTDPCMESLDRGSWCEAMSNRYYFNKRARKCKGFHYTGCGKSGNNFLTKEECQLKCEKRFPRNTSRKLKSKQKSKLPVGYSGTKPEVKTPMIRHFNLNGFNQTYYKSEPQWMDYNFCYGYRYNVSGRDTILNVHFCAQKVSTDCISESYQSTDGEEFCNVFRPFLRGQNLYSWYFGLDSKNPKYILKNGLSGRIQRENETIAAILILKANHCYEIC